MLWKSKVVLGLLCPNPATFEYGLLNSTFFTTSLSATSLSLFKSTGTVFSL